MSAPFVCSSSQSTTHQLPPVGRGTVCRRLRARPVGSLLRLGHLCTLLVASSAFLTTPTKTTPLPSTPTPASVPASRSVPHAARAAPLPASSQFVSVKPRKDAGAREEADTSQRRAWRPRQEYPSSLVDFLNRVHSIDRISVQEEIALSEAVQQSLRDLTELVHLVPTDKKSTPSFADAVAAVYSFEGPTSQTIRDTMNRGLEARSVLVNANLRLVQKALSKVNAPHLSAADLMQEGIIGLIRAAEKYDATKGFRFSTYATIWIRSHITTLVKQERGAIRIPLRLINLRNKINKMEAEFLAENGFARPPTVQEIADHFSMSVEQINRCLETTCLMQIKDAGDMQQMRKWMDAKGAAEWDTSSKDINNEYLRRELQHQLAPHEYDALSLRYGLTDDHRLHTVPEVSAILHDQSVGHTHRTLRSAMKKLRQDDVKQILETYRHD